jgi:hypothetical protein
MAKTITVDLEAVSGKGAIEVEPRTESMSVPSVGSYRSVPFFMPRAQVYYWSSAWQEGERESSAELRRGEAPTFDNPEDALRWLDEPEGE